MKQNLIETPDINYIPSMLPYLINQYFKESFQWDESFQCKSIFTQEDDLEETNPTTVKVEPHPTNVIGLDQLLVQRDKINGRKGIFFNLMVVGKVGVGKSTIIKNIFNVSMEDTTGQYELVYNDNLQIRLTVHEMNSFGCQLNNIYNWVPFVNEIEEYKRQYSFEEGKLYRSYPLVDNRIHVCLFVVEPYQVSDMELKAMKELSEVVNVIPVVNKIDILNAEEVEYVKYDLQRVFNTLGIIPCKNVTNASVHRGQFPIMVDQDNASTLQRFIIDQYMMDLIDGATQQLQFGKDGISNGNKSQMPGEQEEEEEEEEGKKEVEDKKIATGEDWWWKEPYLMEQMEVQTRYRSLLEDQKGKVQEWVNVLFQKQMNLSKEVDTELDKIESARMECQELETRLLHLKLKLNGCPLRSGLQGNNNSDKTLVVTNCASTDDDDSIMDGGYINATE